MWVHHDVSIVDQDDAEVGLDFDMSYNFGLKIQHDLMGEAGRHRKRNASPRARNIPMHVAKEHVTYA